MKHNYIAGGLALAIIIAIAAYIYTHKGTPSLVENTATSTPITTTQSGVTTSGGAPTVSELPVPTAQAPRFDIPLTFDESFSADVRVALSTQFDTVTKVLTADKTNFDAWIKLGTLRKMTHDYKGAETAWLYAAKLYPKSTVPTDNLAVLYLDFLKDYVKAETYFKMSIADDSHDINAYQQLISLYTTYGYKDVAAAKVLLQQGLKANPDNQTLLQIQSNLSNGN